MRILAFSDTHNDSAPMKKALAIYKPHYVFHLGDRVKDINELQTIYNDVNFAGVRGNNDFLGSYPDEAEICIEGFRFYLVHGHRQGVKHTDEKIIKIAKEKKADVALYGHTHIADYQVVDGIHMLNPGSASSILTGGQPTAALITISDNKLRIKIVGI